MIWIGYMLTGSGLRFTALGNSRSEVETELNAWAITHQESRMTMGVFSYAANRSS
jgi:hypothetical protein